MSVHGNEFLWQIQIEEFLSGPARRSRTVVIGKNRCMRKMNTSESSPDANAAEWR
jgi:hypothetical protein